MATGGLVWLSIRTIQSVAQLVAQSVIQSVIQQPAIQRPAIQRLAIQSARRVGGCEITVRRAQSISGAQFAVRLVVHAGTKEVLFSIENEMILTYLIWH